MINNRCKTKDFNSNLQVAGVFPGDANIEFVGVRKTKKVLWMQNGCTRYFSDLPMKYFTLLKAAYQKDHQAQRFLKDVTPDLSKQVELFTYYMWGDLDTTPDIIDGQLMPCENFRDKANCPSLLWNSKNINIGNHILTPRQLVIIDLMAKDMPDKAIASSMSISPKTLDNHKQQLFKSLGVNTKYAVLKLCFQYKIIA